MKLTLNQLKTYILTTIEKYPEHKEDIYKFFSICSDTINYDGDEESAIQQCYNNIESLIKNKF